MSASTDTASWRAASSRASTFLRASTARSVGGVTVCADEDGWAEEPKEGLADCPLAGLADCPVEGCVDCPLDELADCPVEDLADCPVEDLADCPAGGFADRTVDRLAARAAEGTAACPEADPADGAADAPASGARRTRGGRPVATVRLAAPADAPARLRGVAATSCGEASCGVLSVIAPVLAALVVYPRLAGPLTGRPFGQGATLPALERHGIDENQRL